MVSSREWVKLINKKAKGLDNADFGEVIDVDSDHIITKRIDNHIDMFYLPKQELIGYDNKEVIFRLTHQEAKKLYSRRKLAIKETKPIVKFANSIRTSPRKNGASSPIFPLI
jgi:hypothetical protein